MVSQFLIEQTKGNGRAAIFYRGKEGLVAQEGKEGWLRRWEGVCQQGQEQNSAVIEGMDKDESGNWRKGLLA